MRYSALLIVISMVVHLFIVDAVFFLVPEGPLVNPYLILVYNGVWLLMAFSIWTQRYVEAKS